MHAKFKFVEFIAAKLNKFLRGFQIDQPMVPLVLKEIITSLIKMFILSSAVQKADTTLKLLRIDTSDRNIYKPYDFIDVGMAAKMYISEYRKSKQFKESTTKKFYDSVYTFLSSLTSPMMEKCPLRHLIVRCSSCINPNILGVSSQNETFNKILEKLVSYNKYHRSLVTKSKNSMV